MTVATPRSLAPYVPRVAREWLDSPTPDERHRRIPGSVVFVDISGFTAMSERLSRLGRVGAEHVTDVIGSCFSRLLADAYEFGATLLKFGGDALLLFFSGPGHECRAAAAALEMRRAVREIGRFSTEAGQVMLRMTAGVHSGEFDFFLVGRSHRELLIAGPTATTAEAVEGAASAGQIVVSHATAAMLPSANLGAAVGPGRLLRGAIVGVNKGGVETYDAARDLGPLIPVGLRGVLADADGQSEHRRVTIAFVHFAGFDDILSRSGPELAATLLDELVGTVQEVVDPRRVCFLGTDLAPDGGKIILTAGAPIGHGDDEEQMLLALNDLFERRPTIPVRVGVNTGAVFAGEIGTIHRRNYTVMGDAVNLAARLMAKAKPGQILATRSTLDAPRTLFETAALEPFLVKGKRRPVSAYTVGRARGVRAAVASGDLPIVGRDDELARALGLVEGLAGGSGGLLELVGPPGSGKSRFVAELERQAAPVPIRRVQCRLYQAATPYFPFRHLLPELIGVEQTDDIGADDALRAFAIVERLTSIVETVAPDLQPWLSLLGIPLGVEISDSDEAAALDEHFRKARLEDSMVELLATLVTEPTIVCFEDVHWMDEASGDLLRAIARSSTQRPWLVCVTRRDTTTGFVAIRDSTDVPEVVDAQDVVDAVDRTEHGERIDLEPLSDDASVALVDAVTGSQPLPRHVVRSLVARSDGNPLFLLELLNALRDGGDLESLPDTVEGLITARIDRLPPEDRSLLRHLSVLGGGFRSEYASAVQPGGQPLTPQSLRRLGEFLSIDSTSWVTFRHALVRDVAYAGLPFGTRRRLHGQVADSIVAASDEGSEGQAALLSVHFLRAQRYREAWGYAVEGADAARQVSANIEATTLYERALWAARHLDDVSDEELAVVLEALGDVADLAGLYEQSYRAYASTRALLVARDDRVSTARVLLKEAFIAERRARYTGAVRAIRRAERTLDGASGVDADRLRAQLSVWLSAIRAGQGRLAEAARAALLGTHLAQAAGDDQALARGLLVLDYAEAALGRPHTSGGAARALEIYTTIGDSVGEAVAANNLGAVAYFAGRWTDAITWYTRARSARVKTGDPVNTAFGDANIAEILADQGRWAEADELLRQAGAVWTAAGDLWGRGFVERLRGLIAGRSGHYGEAAALLESSRVAFAKMGALPDVVATDVAIAEVLVLQGRGADALEVLAGCAAVSALDHLAPAWHRLRGVALIQSGQPGRHELETALTLAREHESDHQIALALDALEQIGANSVDSRSEEAAEIFRRLDVVVPVIYPFVGKGVHAESATSGT
jgi:class 3 adenylate cyclase/tetratricopeptide (TPR) repeat protein